MPLAVFHNVEEPKASPVRTHRLSGRETGPGNRLGLQSSKRLTRGRIPNDGYSLTPFFPVTSTGQQEAAVGRKLARTNNRSVPRKSLQLFAGVIPEHGISETGPSNDLTPIRRERHATTDPAL